MSSPSSTTDDARHPFPSSRGVLLPFCARNTVTSHPKIREPVAILTLVTRSSDPPLAQHDPPSDLPKVPWPYHDPLNPPLPRRLDLNKSNKPTGVKPEDPLTIKPSKE